MNTVSKNTGSEPRIYVACLSSYNSGILHGVWIDANQDPDDIEREIEAMLEESTCEPGEEWAVHDSEGFDGWSHGEHPALEDVSRVAKALAEHGDVMRAALDNFHDVDEAIEAVEEHYQGSYDSLEDYAQELLEETGQLQEVPESLRTYIDFESYGRDLELWARP